MSREIPYFGRKSRTEKCQKNKKKWKQKNTEYLVELKFCKVLKTNHKPVSNIHSSFHSECGKTGFDEKFPFAFWLSVQANYVFSTFSYVDIVNTRNKSFSKGKEKRVGSK